MKIISLRNKYYEVKFILSGIMMNELFIRSYKVFNIIKSNSYVVEIRFNIRKGF